MTRTIEIRRRDESTWETLYPKTIPSAISHNGETLDSILTKQETMNEQNKKDLINVNAVLDIDGRALPNSGKVYDLFGPANKYSAGQMDTYCTFLVEAAAADATTIKPAALGSLAVGMEITLQDSTGTILATISSIDTATGALTITPALSRALALGDLCYRSFMEKDPKGNLVLPGTHSLVGTLQQSISGFTYSIDNIHWIDSLAGFLCCYLSGGTNRVVKLFTLDETGKFVARPNTVTITASSATTFAVSPVGDLAVNINSNTLTSYTIDADGVKSTTTGMEGSYRFACFSSDGENCMVQDASGYTVRQFKKNASGTYATVTSFAQSYNLLSVAFSPDDQYCLFSFNYSPYLVLTKKNSSTGYYETVSGGIVTQPSDYAGKVYWIKNDEFLISRLATLYKVSASHTADVVESLNQNVETTWTFNTDASMATAYYGTTAKLFKRSGDSYVQVGSDATVVYLVKCVITPDLRYYIGTAYSGTTINTYRNDIPIGANGHWRCEIDPPSGSMSQAVFWLERQEPASEGEVATAALALVDSNDTESYVTMQSTTSDPYDDLVEDEFTQATIPTAKAKGILRLQITGSTGNDIIQKRLLGAIE